MTHVILILASLGNLGPSPVLGPPIDRQVRFVKRVTCESASRTGYLSNLEVRIAVPGDDRRQKIASLRFIPRPDQFVDDDHGNRFAVFRRERLSAGETLQVGWTCRVRLRGVEHRVDRSSLKPLTAIPKQIRDTYLAKAAKYRMNDRQVRTIAERLGRESTDLLDLAFRINEHLRGRLTYRNDGKWEDAAQVLRNGHGSCSEYNFAFMALARLNGLPARYVGATALRSNAATYEDTLHHRWTEVYLPGYGWFPVDASRNDGEDGHPVNRWFGKTDGKLLVLMKGDGGRGHPLRWGYVAAVDARRQGDARIAKSKRFVWTRPPKGSATAGNR